MPDAATDAWTRAGALAESTWPKCKVQSTTALAGDASTRRYTRVKLESGETTAPDSLIAMYCEDPASAEAGLEGKQREAAADSPFVNVQRFLATITDSVPEIYARAENDSILLIEDVGDQSLWAYALNHGIETWFGHALELLGEIQTRATASGDCVAFTRRFDETLFKAEFDEFVEFGVSAKAPPGLLDAAAIEGDQFISVLSNLTRTAGVFCHRDYHAWNLHVKDDRIRLFDFQDALLAPAVYDAASLLNDRVTPSQVNESIELSLIETFLKQSSTPSTGLSIEVYNLAGLQRSLKVIGRFHHLGVKGKPRYVDMVPDAIASALRFLNRLPEFPALRELVEAYPKS